MKKGNTLKRSILYICLSIGAIIMIGPLFWAISTSLKIEQQAYLFPPKWIPNPIQWENYWEALVILPFKYFFMNSFIQAGSITLGQLITGSLAAYAFSRLKFRGCNFIFLMYIATMIIPIQVIIIPRFILMRWFNWIDTLYAITIPFLFAPYSMFLLKQFFATIPQELFDAAKIDGCNEFRIYVSIVLPLSKTVLATVTIFTFTYVYNSFFWPLIVLNSTERKTLPLGVVEFQTQYYTRWTLMMAAAVAAMMPLIVLFLCLQKYFVKGITTSGLKM